MAIFCSSRVILSQMMVQNRCMFWMVGTIDCTHGHITIDFEEEVVRDSSDTEPCSALAFKVTTDPFFGTLTFTSASTQASCGPSVAPATLRRFSFSSAAAHAKACPTPLARS